MCSSTTEQDFALQSSLNRLICFIQKLNIRAETHIAAPDRFKCILHDCLLLLGQVTQMSQIGYLNVA